MMTTRLAILCLGLLLMTGAAAAAEDPRLPLQLPPEVRADFLEEMRHHMDSLDNLLSRLAEGDFKAAAATARAELVPGSGKGFGRYLPIAFREIGLGMHRAAADFATVADKAATPPSAADWQAAITALEAVSGTCRACHDAFRVE